MSGERNRHLHPVQSDMVRMLLVEAQGGTCPAPEAPPTSLSGRALGYFVSSLFHTLALSLTHTLSVNVLCESVFLCCGAVWSLSLRTSIELQPGRTAMGDRRWAMAAAAATTATGFS